jgi:hypothetical protein
MLHALTGRPKQAAARVCTSLAFPRTTVGLLSIIWQKKKRRNNRASVSVCYGESGSLAELHFETQFSILRGAGQKRTDTQVAVRKVVAPHPTGSNDQGFLFSFAAFTATSI